jgi:hypothetical protein
MTLCFVNAILVPAALECLIKEGLQPDQKIKGCVTYPNKVVNFGSEFDPSGASKKLGVKLEAAHKRKNWTRAASVCGAL